MNLFPPSPSVRCAVGLTVHARHFNNARHRDFKFGAGNHKNGTRWRERERERHCSNCARNFVGQPWASSRLISPEWHQLSFSVPRPPPLMIMMRASIVTKT